MPFASLSDFNKWHKSIQRRCNHASSAGRKQKTVKNRRKLRVNGRKTRVSHIVWHDHTGHWPVWPEVIHHIDGDKTNDVFENLQLMDAADHASLHHAGKSHTKETKSKIKASWTPEMRSKKSVAWTGKNNPMYGKRGENSPSWKGDDVTPSGKYQRIWREKKAQRGTTSDMPSKSGSIPPEPTPDKEAED